MAKLGIEKLSKFAKMTIKAQYRFIAQQLQTIYNANEANIITDWAFETLASITKADLLKTPEQIISADLMNTLTKALKDLLQHKPVQYVVGEAWFYRMKLEVNEAVLIPRPETEELVQLVLDAAKASLKPSIKILDIGTGSGCIAIAIQQNYPAAVVTAIDISATALQLAKKNAATQNAKIDFLQVDFLDEMQWAVLPNFDLIVSNPPYIPIEEKEQMDWNVTGYEPHEALFVPNHSPLVFYEKIAAFAATHLNTNGKVLMETHENFAKETAALFTQQFINVLIKKDLFDRERMVMAELKSI